jgi:hypothetical protein
MHAHGPTASLVTWMITADRRTDEDRRLRHLVALADARTGGPSWVERARTRLSGRSATPAPVPALDCCATA